MITKEQRIEIAAKIAEHITKPESEGRVCGMPGLITAPQIWYIDGDCVARPAVVIGFVADDPVIIAASNPHRIQNHLAFTVYE